MMNIFGNLSLSESYSFSMILFSVIVIIYLFLYFLQNKTKSYEIFGSLLLWVIYVLTFGFFTTESDTGYKLFYIIIPAVLIFIYLLYKKKINFIDTFKRFIIILFVCTTAFFFMEISDNK